MEAQGRAGQAHGRTQLHDGLVCVAGALGVEQLVRSRLYLHPAARAQAQNPRHHPLHIAVDHRDWFAERDAGDSGGGVLADARQPAQCFGGLGQHPPMLGSDHPRCPVQHARAPVVAQPAPQREHFRLLRIR